MGAGLLIRRIKVVNVAVLAAGFAIAGCDRGPALRAPAIGAPAPAFTAHDMNGAAVSLADLRGKVVVLNEWATWCGPCRDEMPQLEELHRKYASKGVMLIGVSIDAAGMGAEVSDFARDHGMTYPIWLDPDNDFTLKFATVGVPETFVVDREGIIRWRRMGALPPGDTTLASAIRRIAGA
jgi:peroxiredoxin